MKVNNTMATCALTIAGALALASTATAGVPLGSAVEQTFQGKYVNGVQVGRHGFDLKPVGLPGLGIVSTKDGVLYATGYFRHRIVGKDDKVFYTIEVRKGRAPIGTITKIEYNGWPGYLPGLPKWGKDAARTLRKWREGSWETAAQQIVDALAARLAAER